MTYQIQIDDEVRDATPEEVAEIEAAYAEAKEIKQAEADKMAIKSALLERLGIDEDEAKLLVG